MELNHRHEDFQSVSSNRVTCKNACIQAQPSTLALCKVALQDMSGHERTPDSDNIATVVTISNCVATVG